MDFPKELQQSLVLLQHIIAFWKCDDTFLWCLGNIQHIFVISLMTWRNKYVRCFGINFCSLEFWHFVGCGVFCDYLIACQLLYCFFNDKCNDHLVFNHASRFKKKKKKPTNKSNVIYSKIIKIPPFFPVLTSCFVPPVFFNNPADMMDAWSMQLSHIHTYMAMDTSTCSLAIHCLIFDVIRGSGVCRGQWQ